MSKQQRVWDEIDKVATREAKALARARKYHTRHKLRASTIERHQAVFDEHLEVHYVQCSFCGRVLREDPLPNQPPARQSIYGQEADICFSCSFLAKKLFRKPPLPTMQTA